MKLGFANLLVPKSGLFLKRGKLVDGTGAEVLPHGEGGKIKISPTKAAAIVGKKKLLADYRKTHPDTDALTMVFDFVE